jgi:hypothetical protein
MLRARSTSIGPWEEYLMNGTEWGFDIIALANGRYVSAEDYSGGNPSEPFWSMLRARGTSVGDWELYEGPIV